MQQQYNRLAMRTLRTIAVSTPTFRALEQLARKRKVNVDSIVEPAIRAGIETLEREHHSEPQQASSAAA